MTTMTVVSIAVAPPARVRLNGILHSPRRGDNRAFSAISITLPLHVRGEGRSGGGSLRAFYSIANRTWQPPSLPLETVTEGEKEKGNLRPFPRIEVFPGKIRGREDRFDRDSRQRKAIHPGRFHQVAVDWNISNSNMAAGTVPGETMSKITERAGTRAEPEHSAKAITLFDTIIFVTENNAEKPGRNRESGVSIETQTMREIHLRCPLVPSSNPLLPAVQPVT